MMRFVCPTDSLNRAFDDPLLTKTINLLDLSASVPPRSLLAASSPPGLLSIASGMRDVAAQAESIIEHLGMAGSV
jgi:hypothetical protein